jgi:hypothetical protein
MGGYSMSQKIEIIVMIASIILYFAVTTYAQQNIWSFFFAVALICFIVGRNHNYVDMLFMKDTTFEYEPHYENWQKKQEADM